jgi:hypothetical protein
MWPHDWQQNGNVRSAEEALNGHPVETPHLIARHLFFPLMRRYQADDLREPLRTEEFGTIGRLPLIPRRSSASFASSRRGKPIAGSSAPA